MLELLIWILISSERYLELTCTTKAAGVAWVTSEVEITELTKPDLSNISVMFSTGFPLTSTPKALLLVFIPVLNAVPEEAESVTIAFAECVSTFPE